jgi:hypothetical protein
VSATSANRDRGTTAILSPHVDRIGAIKEEPRSQDDVPEPDPLMRDKLIIRRRSRLERVQNLLFRNSTTVVGQLHQYRSIAAGVRNY